MFVSDSIRLCVCVNMHVCARVRKSDSPAILSGDGVTIGRVINKADVHSHQWGAVGSHHLSTDNTGMTVTHTHRHTHTHTRQ